MTRRTSPHRPAAAVEALPEERQWELIYRPGAPCCNPLRRRVFCARRGCDQFATHLVTALLADGTRRRRLCAGHTADYRVAR